MLSGVLALDPDSKPSSQPFPRVQCNTSRPAPRLVLQIGRGRSLSRSMYNSNTMICYIGASTRQGVTAEGDSAIAERPWLQLTTQEIAAGADRCYPGASRCSRSRQAHTHAHTTHILHRCHSQARCTTLDTQNTQAATIVFHRYTVFRYGAGDCNI